MERFLDYVEIVDLNLELKFNDFCKINGSGFIYDEYSQEKEIYKLRTQDSVVLRSKGISLYVAWDIYDLYCEKCKEEGLPESIELLKSLKFDYANFSKTLKKRNILRALLFLAQSDEVKNVIQNCKTEAAAVEELCNQNPRFVTEDEAKALLNFSWKDAIDENFRKLNKDYKLQCQKCLSQLVLVQ